jgi:hypothetical protein
MAGAFTHMAIVGEAIKSFPPEKTYGKILRLNLNFVTMGSVSPDVPYLGQLALRGSTWADIMHYHQTNGIVKNAVNSLSVAKSKDKAWECQLAWLSGFAGHLVADATIHPIVESIVGPCTDRSTMGNHKQCEMMQDVLIFKDVKNLEVSGSEYTDHLISCRDSNYFDKVAEFWSEHAMVNCPAAGRPSIKDIFISYFKLLDTADGSNGLAKAFRHLGSGLVYNTSQELKNNSPQLVERYYNNVSLPNGLTGSFRKEGFEYAVKNLVTVWSKIDRALFSTDNIVEIVSNWNLDTGMDQTTGIKTYWS